MGFLDSLPTMADVNAERRATPKHQMTPNVITKEEKRKVKKANEDTFRAAVWARDKGICRATGDPLVKGGTTDPHRLGEVDHTLMKSTNPDRVYDVSNGVLMQKFLNRLRKVSCPEAPEHKYFDYSGPEDRGEQQTFVWRDRAGNITKTRIG